MIFNGLNSSLHKCEPQGSHILMTPCALTSTLAKGCLPSSSNKQVPCSAQLFYTQRSRITRARCVHDPMGQRLTTESPYMWNIWVLPGHSLWLTSFLDGKNWKISVLLSTAYTVMGTMLCYQDVWFLRRWLPSHFMGALLKDVHIRMQASC